MWASDNTDTPERVFTDDYINHQESDAKGGVTALNLEAWKDLVADYHDAFTDSDVVLVMQIAEGDLVATRWEFTATHSGDYMGAAPTNKRLTWTGIQIDRFDNGRIAESWVDWDKYRLFQGLGLAP